MNVVEIYYDIFSFTGLNTRPENYMLNWFSVTTRFHFDFSFSEFLFGYCKNVVRILPWSRCCSKWHWCRACVIKQTSETFTSKNYSPGKKIVFSDWNSLRILYFSALQTVRVVIEEFIAVVIGYCKNVVRILTWSRCWSKLNCSWACIIKQT